MKYITTLLCFAVLMSCKSKLSKEEKETIAETASPVTVETAIGPLTLEAPFSSKSVTKNSKVIAWPEGQTPLAPEGFKVTRFADELEHPRWTYIAPNNDIFVTESNTKNSANRISLLRDNDNDGKVDNTGEEWSTNSSGLMISLGYRF